METPVSLLARLRQPADARAWPRFVELYTPLLYHWARRAGVPDQEAVDLGQEVFAHLVVKLPEFDYRPGGSFRGWLRTVLLNKWREHHRRTGPAAQGVAADPAGPDPAAELAEAEYRHYLVERALQLMRSEFQPTTWRACWEHVVSGRSAAEVAAELGISEGAVYVAKHRVLRRLRRELEGLLD